MGIDRSLDVEGRHHVLLACRASTEKEPDEVFTLTPDRETMEGNVRHQIHPAEAQLPSPDEREHFSGTVRMQSLSVAEHDLRVTAVFFEPDARTRPHTHTGDQLLVCVSGMGVVAIANSAERVIANDVVLVPKNTWHWHGATRNSPMCHVSVLSRDSASVWNDIETRDWEDYREG